MNRRQRFHLLPAVSTTFLLVFLLSLPTGLTEALSEASDSDELETCRRIGKAFYENDDFEAAAEQFRRCIELSPRAATDYFNLGLILMRAADHRAALDALKQAESLDPQLLSVHYLRGIIWKREGEFTQATESLQRVVTDDPECVGAYYNLAICYKSTAQYTRAIAALKAGVDRAPLDPNCHYQLMTLYRRIGNLDAAARHAEIFDRLKDTQDEAEKTPEALERSKYSYILEVPPTGQDVTPNDEATVRFVDVTSEAGLASPTPPPMTPQRRTRTDIDAPEPDRRDSPGWGGSIVLGDYDDDGDRDIYLVNANPKKGASGNVLYRNESEWQFIDATREAGVGDRGLGIHPVFGDYDNDTHLDLYVVNCGPNVLYHNRGDGTFEDVSESARVDEPLFGSRAGFVDYDHDNDLDILIANNMDLTDRPVGDAFASPRDCPGQVNTLLRNNGNGTFTDLTDEAGLLVDFSQTRDLVYADFDGDDDTDLFFANFDSPSLLFLNARMGAFTAGGSFSPAIQGGVCDAVEADFNRDGHPDLIVLAGTNLFLYANGGQADFTSTPVTIAAPPTVSLEPRAVRPEGDREPGTADGMGRIEVTDYDNDGWLDLLLLDPAGGHLRLLAGAGQGAFRDVTSVTGLDKVTGTVADFAAGDLDGDGDDDLALQTDRGAILLRNDGGNRFHWLDVSLHGNKVNRHGYGATVEVAAGGHYQKQTVDAELAHFGLGPLTHVHVVRVTWPNGMVQNVIQPAIDRTLQIEEYVKVSASCAFLWADGGQGVKLINEILGIGPLGVPIAPGSYFPVDCTELTKIEPNQLTTKNGQYELCLTEDLREIAFVDQVTLRAVDHPMEWEIVPNEMFTGPPFPQDMFFAVSEPRAPRSAVDDRGQDVLDLVRRRDGRYPTFPLTSYDGLARSHSLTLDLGDLSDLAQILLYLDSWIYWADSSVSWALFQNPDHSISPLKLEVRDENGHWHTAVESVGLPTSKGSVVPVDLTGRFLCRDWHIRLSTTMCVYFDRIFVSANADASRCRVTTLPVAQADLRFRGFSKLTRDELGYENFDYHQVTASGSWKPPSGEFTRYGMVTPLLARPDDMYVVFGPGDELRMRFDALRLPELAPGCSRSFVFYANGWVKDGDLNTKFSRTVEPLPFHGMSGYPYPATERYPNDPEHLRYLQTYQTRPSQSRTGELTNSQD